MKDCLILVERGVSEADLVKTLLRNELRNYFKTVRSDAPPEQVAAMFNDKGNQSVLADYGIASEVSLTSVVLATELHEAGLGFEVIDDDDVEHNYAEAIRRKLCGFRMVALSTTYTVRTQTILNLLKLIRSVDPNIPVLLGGQGLSAWRMHFDNAASLYDLLKDADALFFGEVEGLFAEIVRRMSEGRSLAGLPGAVALKEPRNPKALPLYGATAKEVESVSVDVNTTLLPNWDVLKEYDFNDGAIQHRGLPAVASLEEGRGCSFKCKFCSYPMYSEFRRKTPERVVAELRSVRRTGFHSMSFCGAEFLNPLHQSKPVFEAVAAASIPIEIWAYARLDLVSHNPWIADLMDKANFRSIQFGMESGDRSILKRMSKNYDPTKMAAGAHLLKSKNISVYASVIIGYPGETEETLANTESVLADCDFGYVIIHGLAVVPGSPLWHRRHEYNLTVERGLWSHPTMSISDLPKHIKKMFVGVNEQSSSLINNITQNFSNTFFDGRPEFDRLIATSRTLQKIIHNEWRSGGADVGQRRAHWDELRQRVDRIPSSLSSS